VIEARDLLDASVLLAPMLREDVDEAVHLALQDAQVDNEPFKGNGRNAEARIA